MQVEQGHPGNDELVGRAGAGLSGGIGATKKHTAGRKRSSSTSGEVCSGSGRVRGSSQLNALYRRAIYTDSWRGLVFEL